jgi:hypothetical protein
MYESRHQSPLKRRQFAIRMVRHVGMAFALLAVSLGLGIVGYEAFEHLPFLDALLNSAMLLGGIGPVNAPVTSGGKLFASFYALYAGLVFIVTAALLLTPVVHRLLHRFHWKEDG